MIAFRPLAAADFRMLTRWLAEPHLRRFVQKTPMSLDEVTAKYGPRVRGEQPLVCHVACDDDVPFGYLQAYRNRDWPDAADGQTDGISLDLHIGEPTFLDRGLGRAMLDAYVRGLALPHFAQTTAYIAHDLANTAALACSKAVGFKPVREFVEDGEPMLLLRLEL
ncbi:GNAT family N-acetyltransferase [Phenylobacterium sp.]|uniref:GNAT family N-acetyltransferase n=1 Tax=Phenylobacterium sp. TaxID=1871053 RepID=UPI0027202724|nr:GNAT family N-acetyltransferase [Phenylobacterium sp.]MDO8380575.1 GNAT family N-acetyltransferase [Phenylobacterium sp.]